MLKKNHSTSRLISKNYEVKNNFYEVGSEVGNHKVAGIQEEEDGIFRSNTENVNVQGGNHQNN